MAIQWFPGHMHSTRKAISERLKTGIDVVIELLDARLPGASANPLLASLAAGKPTLKLLNKDDLADPERTALWLDHYNQQPHTRALALRASANTATAALVALCRSLAPLRGGMTKPLRLLVCGIPNVGKSTLINQLMGKAAAKTGDEAGITQREQYISLASDVHLFDTPGMLWPKITVARSGYHLAASGAVGRNAYDAQEVALELLDSLRPHYGARIEDRYRLGGQAGLGDIAGMPAEDLLQQIARQRGLVQAGARLNLQAAAEGVINDFRAGALGRITLETPQQHAAWSAQALVDQAALEQTRAARKPRRARPGTAGLG